MSGGVITVTNLTRGLETKPVFDWDREPLGTIVGSELDPKTRDPTSLIIGLSDDAREQLGTEKDTISLPFDYVFGIRRDEVRLNRGLSDLLPDVRTDREESSVEEPVVELPA